MTPEQICELLDDEYLQFLPLEGKLVAKRVEQDALVFLFAYAEVLIEVFFSLDDGKLMGSSILEDKERLMAYINAGDLSSLAKRDFT